MEVGLWTSTSITSQTTGKLSDKHHQLNVITLHNINISALPLSVHMFGFFHSLRDEIFFFIKSISIVQLRHVFFLKLSPCPHRPRPVYPGPPWTQPCCGRGAVWPAAPCPSCWRTPHSHAAARGDVWWHTTCTSAPLDKMHCGMKEETLRCLWNCRCRDNAV